MANTTSTVSRGCQCTGRDRSRRYSNGRTREALETGVDAGRIGVDQFALARRQRRIHAIGKSLEPVQAIAPVGRQGRIADELRQSSGGHPPRQVHLEVAILRVHVAGRVGDVVASSTP